MAKSSSVPFGAALAARLEREIDTALGVIGEDIRRTAAESILEGGIPSPNHIVSNPGEPPNADTNTLDKSIRAEPVSNHSVTIGAHADYARHLEYGTTRMAARPYMRPALAKNGENIQRRIASAVERATKR